MTVLPCGEPCDDTDGPVSHTTWFVWPVCLLRSLEIHFLCLPALSLNCVAIPKEHKSDWLINSLSLPLPFSPSLSQHINCVNVGTWLSFPVLLRCINMETQLCTHAQDLLWKRKPIFSHIISDTEGKLEMVLNNRNAFWWWDCVVGDKHDQRYWFILLCLF